MAKRKAKPEKPAKQILSEQANWHDSEGIRLTEQVIRYLNSSGTSASVLLQTFRSMQEMRDKAVNAASKLIGFQEPKLEAVSIAKEETHRFVVIAPPEAPDVDTWLRNCQQQMKTRAVSDDLRIDKAIIEAKRITAPPLKSKELEDEEEPDSPLDDTSIRPFRSGCSM
jgi:hypothetical protein